MARNVVRARIGETELIARRQRNTKVFKRPDGKVRVVSRLRPLHWDDKGTWVDVDDTPESPDGGRTWTTPSTPYNLQWDSETLTLSYESKRGGDVKVRLAALDGAPFTQKVPVPNVVGQDIRVFVAPELEIVLRVRSHGVEIYKILHGPSAPTALTWEVIEGDASNIRFDLMNTSGLDNRNNSQARKAGGQLNARRRIEMAHSRTPDDLTSNPGKKTYLVTETFTGRTRRTDQITRARTWVNEVEYPVEIDVTVNESVVADTDDGYGTGGFWYQTPLKLNGTAFNAGIRFQSVNVPQGQTLDSAILTFNVTASGGSFTSPLIMSGEAVDDAASWANSSANDPDTMAATTASANVSVQATGIRTLDVTTIVQEIVNRAGWVANNNLRLGISDASGTGTGYMFWEDYGAAGTAEPELQIQYTPAVAGGGTGRLLMLGVGR